MVNKRRGAKRTRDAIVTVGVVLVASIMVWWFMRSSRKPTEGGPSHQVLAAATAPYDIRALQLRAVSHRKLPRVCVRGNRRFAIVVDPNDVDRKRNHDCENDWCEFSILVSRRTTRRLLRRPQAENRRNRGRRYSRSRGRAKGDGGTWGNSRVIVFAPDVDGPYFQVADTGGTPSPIGRIAKSDSLRGNRWPVFLPDGRHFLYVSLASSLQTGDVSEIRVGSLDSTDDEKISSENVRTVAFAHDHLFFVRNGVLYSQRFDNAQLRTTGEPIPVTDRDVAGPSVFYPSEFSISQSGMLAFQSSTDLASHLVWFDPTGKELGTFEGTRYFDPAFSPDGRMLAGSCDQSNNGKLAICVQDLARGVTTRLTAGPSDRFPVWSRDGRAIAYSSNGAIYRISADGSNEPELVSTRGIPTGWSSDGRILSFGTHRGVVSLALSSLTATDPSDMGPGAEGQLSPRMWIAYAWDGLVIRRFPELGQRVQVTSYGASQPRWSRDGRTLFYISTDKKLMAVDFYPSKANVSATRVLAQTRIIASSLTGFQYDVAPDGRFLVNSLSSDAAPLTLMTGWLERLGQ